MKARLPAGLALISVLWALSGQPAIAEDCYKTLNLPASGQKPINRVLNIFIDQTMALTPAMKDNLLQLVADWGQAGERVRIARFSAFTKGQYTELIYDAGNNNPPDEEYLFNLRKHDSEQLHDCLRTQGEKLHEEFMTAMRKTLDQTDPRLAKSEIFYSLKILADHLLHDDEQIEQSVLIVTDGMENSDIATFSPGKPLATLQAGKLLAQLKQRDLAPDWKQAKIYVYGLGQVSTKIYASTRLLQPLKMFWSDYFQRSNGEVMQLGTPTILSMSLKNPQ